MITDNFVLTYIWEIMTRVRKGNSIFQIYFIQFTYTYYRNLLHENLNVSL